MLINSQVLPVILIIVLLSAPYFYEGMSFVLSCAFSLLFISVVINLFHVFRLNRRTFLLGQAALFVPCTFIVSVTTYVIVCLQLFVVSILYMILFAFGTLLSFISFIESFRYSSVRLVVTYAIVSVSVLLKRCYYRP